MNSTNDDANAPFAGSFADADDDHLGDHGGDLDRARAEYGGEARDWIDLSTGVNRRPYPVPPLSAQAWTALPQARALDALLRTARRRYGVPPSAGLVAASGAQALIQLMPRLAESPGVAAVVSPTYNEHARAFHAAGWEVRPVAEPEDGAGADALVVVDPNNPDGRRFGPERLSPLLEQVGLLVVDESFADAVKEPVSTPLAGAPGLVTLRSFGKFYGLAGLRLGFAAGDPALIGRLETMLGPWAVSGPALEIGRAALDDDAWAVVTRARLARDAAHLDRIATRAGWRLVGGAPLFRLYETVDARTEQARLARARIWSRVFPYSATWLRLGHPGEEDEWRRLETAFDAF